MNIEEKAISDKSALVRRTIKNFEWFYFGRKDFQCKGFEKHKDSYLKKTDCPIHAASVMKC
jgi:hypothetical protein